MSTTTETRKHPDGFVRWFDGVLSEEQITAYWHETKSLKEIAREAGMSIPKLSGHLRGQSHMVAGYCNECSGEIIQRGLRSRPAAHWQCQSAASDRAKQANERAQETLGQDGILRSREAFAARAYEALDELHLRYLASLVSSGDPEKARRTCGLGVKQEGRILRELDRLHLVFFREDGALFWDAGDQKEVIVRSVFNHSPLPIIPTEAARCVFRSLKERHAFVFPEIPLCCVVPLEAAQGCFGEGVGKSYYLTCRLDFVVCDAQMRPLFAVEYDGGHHDDSQQKPLDDFKEAALSAVRVQLHRIRASDLSRLQEALP